jgi:hypothetical protein
MFVIVVIRNGRKLPRHVLGQSVDIWLRKTKKHLRQPEV